MPTVAVLPFYRVGATPLALEIMRIYNAGSSVYASVYADTNGTIPMGNSDLVPIQADANGLFPVVFVPVGAAYDIKFYDSTLHPRDTYQGIRPTSGGGSAVDVDLVKTSATDTNGGYLGDKLLNSSSVSWSIVNAGGYEQIQATVNPAYVLDWKVKTDAGDSTPDYLGNKIESGTYVALTLDASTHKIKASFTGPAYVPQAGGAFTGAVSFGGTVMAVGGCFFGDTIINGAMTISGDISGNSAGFTGVVSANGLQLPGIAGSGSWLTIDGSGNVTRTGSPVDHMVLHDVGDLIPGYLGTKIVAGSGITINTTTDGVDGVVMHISASTTAANKVKYDAGDTVAGYLGAKIVAGNGIAITTSTGVGGTVMTLSKTSDYLETDVSSVTPVAFGAATNVTLGSLVLPAGDWDVESVMTAQVTFASGTAKAEGYAVYWATGDFALKDYDTHGVLQSVAASAPYLATLSWTLTRRRFQLVASTTVYVGAALTGTYTNGQAWGRITARRVG